MPKILVVDDEPQVRQLMERILAGAGYQVFQAETGAQALAAVEAESPEVVLLDYRLASENGLDVLKKLKGRFPAIPVVMVTGYDRADSAVELMKAGARDYLVKPFDNEKLVGLVKTVLARPGSAGSPPLPVDEAPDPAGVPGVRRSGWAFGLGLLVLAGVGGWIWRTARPPVPGGITVAAPGTHVAAMVVESQENRMWLGDWYLQKIYGARLSPAFEVTETRLVPDRHWTGLAVAGEHLVGCDPLTKKIYRYQIRSAWKELKAVPSPGSSPSGVCWDGVDLWSADSQTDQIYRHQWDAALTVKGTWAAPGPSPVGLAWSEGSLWVADSQTECLYQLKVGAQGPESAIQVFRLNPRQGRLAGMAVADGTVWTVYEGHPVMYQDRLDALRREKR